MDNKSSRRNALKKLAAGTIAMAAVPFTSFAISDDDNMKKLKGNINHSVCRWTYNHLKLEELCVLVKKLGFSAIDLVGPKEWDVLKKYGIYSSMCNGAEINLVDGWNDKKNHPVLIKNYTDHIELVA